MVVLPIIIWYWRVVNDGSSYGKLMLIKGGYIGWFSGTKVHYVCSAYIGVSVRLVLLVGWWNHHGTAMVVRIDAHHLILRLVSDQSLRWIGCQSHHQLVSKVGGVFPWSYLIANLGTLSTRVLWFLEAILPPLVISVLIAKLTHDKAAQHWLYLRVLYYINLLIDLLIIIIIHIALAVQVVHVLVSVFLLRVRKQLRLLQNVQRVEVVVPHVQWRLGKDLVQQALPLQH